MVSTRSGGRSRCATLDKVPELTPRRSRRLLEKDYLGEQTPRKLQFEEDDDIVVIEENQSPQAVAETLLVSSQEEESANEKPKKEKSADVEATTRSGNRSRRKVREETPLLTPRRSRRLLEKDHLGEQTPRKLQFEEDDDIVVFEDDQPPQAASETLLVSSQEEENADEKTVKESNEEKSTDVEGSTRSGNGSPSEVREESPLLTPCHSRRFLEKDHLGKQTPRNLQDDNGIIVIEKGQPSIQEKRELESEKQKKVEARRFKRKKVSSDTYNVKIKKAAFAVISLDKKMKTKLEPSVNFKTDLLKNRTANLRCKNASQVTHRNKWAGRF